MSMLRLCALLFILSLIACKQPQSDGREQSKADKAESGRLTHASVRGALISTRFHSFEELKSVVKIEYHHISPNPEHIFGSSHMVRLTHSSDGKEVCSVLKAGVSEDDFKRVKEGNFWDKLWLGFHSPYTGINVRDLLRISALARRRGDLFGEGDVAFYDLAKTMVGHIHEADLALIPATDLTEKGYINTFNHITAQAIMTTCFSERLADFIADAHERHNMPELISGAFSEEQIADLETGPVDNYVDIINNEWGQELGKKLQKKYQINRDTDWAPELVVNYLNDIQAYYSWAFQIGFHPFRATDEIVIRFSLKMNGIMKDIQGRV